MYSELCAGRVQFDLSHVRQLHVFADTYTYEYLTCRPNLLDMAYECYTCASLLSQFMCATTSLQTAYFVIPETVEHGEELICSYYACRNAGIKFRYCSHCKIPVAKRNFRKRHNHGLMAPKVSGSGAGADLASGTGGVIASARGGDTEEESAGASSSKKTASSKKGALGGLAGRSGLPAAASAACSTSTSARGKPIEAERCTRWAELLCDRPSTVDSNAMSAWLMDVLAVSDLEKPLAAKSAGTVDGSDDDDDNDNVRASGVRGSDSAAVALPTGTAAAPTVSSAAASAPPKEPSPAVDEEGMATDSVANAKDEATTCRPTCSVVSDRNGNSVPATSIAAPALEESSKKRERTDEVADDFAGGDVGAKIKKARTTISDEKEQADEAVKETASTNAGDFIKYM